MTHEKIIISLTAFFCLWAFSHQNALAHSQTQWSCTVYDRYEEAWTSRGADRLSAINNALDKCNRYSARGRSCSPNGAECTIRDQAMRAPWACRAIDKFGETWVRQSDDRQDAINRAWRACKRQSSQPMSCRVAKSMCDTQLDHPDTVRWRCKAFDRLDMAWSRSSEAGRPEAMRHAKDACHRNSNYPRSCFALPRDCKVATY